MSGIAGQVTEKSGTLGRLWGCMSQETCRFAGTEPQGSDHEGLIVLYAGSPAAEGSVCNAFFPNGEKVFFCDSYPLFIERNV